MKTHALRLSLAVAGLVLAGAAGGCYYPDYPRIVGKLSDENYELGKQVEGLKREVADRDATIAHNQKVIAGRLPRVETLSAERLSKLFTVGRVEIRNGTDVTEINSREQNGFRVVMRTTTAESNVLPASGVLTIEAFDLAASGETRLGKWVFTPEQMKANWFDGFGLYHFAFDCPWAQRPEHSSITFKAHFVDGLTGAVFTDQKTLNVHLRAAEAATGAATMPASGPATQEK